LIDTEAYVAWCWKESATAGFDIVSYTGDAANDRNISHSLSAVPHFMIVKSRSDPPADHWWVYHKSNGNTGAQWLNLNAVFGTGANDWAETTPTSSVFTIGTQTGLNYNTATFIAYLFSEKQGYSKFGSYTGNGSTDGTFVYTGFKPAWILIKDTGSTQSWFMYDNKRDTINPNTKLLTSNNDVVEEDSASTGNTFDVDFLSNGFKIRTTDAGVNTSGNTYVYMAFAEAPFVNSNGVPCNAR